MGLDHSLIDAREWISDNSYPGQTMYARSVQLTLQPSQSLDLNTFNLGARWPLETEVNEL